MAVLRLTDLLDAAATRLAGLETPALDAEALFRGVSGFSRADVLARGAEPVAAEIERRFEGALVRRVSHEPIQYILGNAAFWRDEFRVTPAVLIPRPETETLVEAVAGRLRGVLAPRILDLGTGSGCIALSLLRELPNARATAVDVSPPALLVARENASRLGLADRIEFRLSNWFSAIGPDEAFDAVVSNPPYVPVGSLGLLPREVRDFEPAQSLFAEAGDDLSSYRAIFRGALTRAVRPGLIAVEVGQGQAEGVAALSQEGGFKDVEFCKDLASIDRVVLARRP